MYEAVRAEVHLVLLKYSHTHTQAFSRKRENGKLSSSEEVLKEI